VLPPLLSSFANDATRVPMTVMAMAVLLLGIVAATRGVSERHSDS
jgi:hypothetical protein